MGGLRLDTNRLDTSHSQRLNSGKLLGTGHCGWWCPIEPCPNGRFPVPIAHGSIRHEPFTALEQWKVPRHRLLWVAVGYRARALTGPSLNQSFISLHSSI